MKHLISTRNFKSCLRHHLRQFLLYSAALYFVHCRHQYYALEIIHASTVSPLFGYGHNDTLPPLWWCHPTLQHQLSRPTISRYAPHSIPFLYLAHPCLELPRVSICQSLHVTTTAQVCTTSPLLGYGYNDTLPPLWWYHPISSTPIEQIHQQWMSTS